MNIKNIRRLIKETTRKVRKKIFRKRKGFASYSIVSACYNVESYIDSFVNSIVSQSLDFKRNFQLILVDDGSTDRTNQKIRDWVSKYPKNILCVQKSNGGQASARNEGLKYVSGEWVTFADPDDFYEEFSFERIDKFLRINKLNRISAVSINIINFFENEKKFSNNHALNFKFKNKETIRTVKDSEEYIQLSASSVFFRSEIIRKHNITFDIKCRPNFEDGKFVNTYLMYCLNDNIAFLRKPIYFYTKRKSKNSTLDIAWKNKEKYCDVFVHGYIPLADIYLSYLGYIPRFVQNIIIYDCYWYINYLLNNKKYENILTQNEAHNAIELMKRAYGYCDSNVIEDSRFSFMKNLKIKIGILGFFKKDNIREPVVYLEKIDRDKKELKLRYYASVIKDENIFIGNKRVYPSYEKTISDIFLGEVFCYTRIIWISYADVENSDSLSIDVNGISYLIYCRERKQKAIKLSEIYDCFQVKVINEDSPYANCWLITDRDVQADDNGEHFYRYILNNHPEINAYFLLNRSSHDWERLAKEGFRLISYGSKEHMEAYQNCKNIISSHVDGYTENFFKVDNPWDVIKFTFLQHGVVVNDLSTWLNQKQMDCLCCTSKGEYDAFVDNAGHYSTITRKEVRLTGLARHDNLLKINNPEKIILIMPTWRKALVGRCHNGSDRDFNPKFLDSEYFKAWQSFLNNETLSNVVHNYGYRIIFFPHYSVQKYLSYFQVPEYIEIQSHKDTRIQDLFARGNLMITDYSSVSFDFAYMKKPVLYYQFDRDQIFNENTHTFKSGYFDYISDGFGDVCMCEKDLVQAVEYILKNSCVMTDMYVKRVKDFFVYNDDRNCERIFKAVVDL